MPWPPSPLDECLVFVVVVCMGLLMSVSPSVAQLYGAERFEEIGPCVRQGLWLAIAAALAIRNVEV